MRFASAFTLSVLISLTASLSAQVPAPLRPFISCHLSDGLAVTHKESTPVGAVGRTVVTLRGQKQVPIARGEELSFAYEAKSPFVRVTVEQLPVATFETGKADLIGAFDKLLASDDSAERNYMLKPQINGFEAYGLDKKALGGNVLGIYLLVDDRTHSVVSVDFLNQAVDDRNYSSEADYKQLRDAFLMGYTSCVRANLHAISSPPAPAAHADKAKPAAPVKKKKKTGKP